MPASWKFGTSYNWLRSLYDRNMGSVGQMAAISKLPHFHSVYLLRWQFFLLSLYFTGQYCSAITFPKTILISFDRTFRYFSFQNIMTGIGLLSKVIVCLLRFDGFSSISGWGIVNYIRCYSFSAAQRDKLNGIFIYPFIATFSIFYLLWSKGLSI